jgi:hypothetical protein
MEKVVHVKNSLQNNGTGLHFHCIRQHWTDAMDGVPSILNAPLHPATHLPTVGAQLSTALVVTPTSTSRPGPVSLVESRSMVRQLQTMILISDTFS